LFVTTKNCIYVQFRYSGYVKFDAELENLLFFSFKKKEHFWSRDMMMASNV